MRCRSYSPAQIFIARGTRFDYTAFRWTLLTQRAGPDSPQRLSGLGKTRSPRVCQRSGVFFCLRRSTQIQRRGDSTGEALYKSPVQSARRSSEVGNLIPASPRILWGVWGECSFSVEPRSVNLNRKIQHGYRHPKKKRRA